MPRPRWRRRHSSRSRLRPPRTTAASRSSSGRAEPLISQAARHPQVRDTIVRIVKRDDDPTRDPMRREALQTIRRVEARPEQLPDAGVVGVDVRRGGAHRREPSALHGVADPLPGQRVGGSRELPHVVPWACFLPSARSMRTKLIGAVLLGLSAFVAATSVACGASDAEPATPIDIPAEAGANRDGSDADPDPFDASRRDAADANADAAGPTNVEAAWSVTAATSTPRGAQRARRARSTISATAVATSPRRPAWPTAAAAEDRHTIVKALLRLFYDVKFPESFEGRRRLTSARVDLGAANASRCSDERPHSSGGPLCSASLHSSPSSLSSAPAA